MNQDAATLAQINYIKNLCATLGEDPDDYNFAEMTKAEASEVISYLRGDSV